MVIKAAAKKKAHQQLGAVSAAALLMLSLFSVLLITDSQEGVTGFTTIAYDSSNNVLKIDGKEYSYNEKTAAYYVFGSKDVYWVEPSDKNDIRVFKLNDGKWEEQTQYNGKVDQFKLDVRNEFGPAPLLSTTVSPAARPASSVPYGGSPDSWKADGLGLSISRSTDGKSLSIISTKDNPMNSAKVTGYDEDGYYFETSGGKHYALVQDVGGRNEITKVYDITETGSFVEVASKPQPSVAQSALSTLRQFQGEYAKYSGLGGYSSLFFSQEFLASWRNTVEQKFAELYLGTQYWSSELCSQYVDGQNEGFIFANTPQGLSELAAFVKASRTPEAIDENGNRTYIYFIEVRVKNGNSAKDLSLLEKIKFNVELRGTKTVQLFSSKKEVERGKEFKKLGKNAIVQDSNARYDRICLVLDEAPFRWRLSGNQLCSPIPDSTGTPTSVVRASATASGGSAPAAPEVNDI